MRKINQLYTLIQLLAFIVSVNGAIAEIVQISPSKDNTLYESSSGNLSNGIGDYLFAGNTQQSTNSKRRALIAFDIAVAIPAGATIESASLTLNMSKTSAGTRSFSLHLLQKDWGEGTSNASGQEGSGAIATTGDATWLHSVNPGELWTNAGGDFSSVTSATIPVTGVARYTWGSTSQTVADVQSWLDTPSTNFGWAIIGPESSVSSKRFDSKDHSNASVRPVLDVTYSMAPTPVEELIFPHVDTNNPWNTEIALINNSASQVTGELIPYSNSGDQTSTNISVTLAPKARRQIDVASEFFSSSDIGYIIFESSSKNVSGYTKFFIDEMFRVAIPAVSIKNTGDILIPHIASDHEWWTGISLVNTNASSLNLTIEFNDGQTASVTLPANGHQAFTVRNLFSEAAQPNIGSAVIKNASGVVGLELFGSNDNTGNKYLSGILVRDVTATNLYYPHVASDAMWWTGIVAYNPSTSAASIVLQPYNSIGSALASQSLNIEAGSKLVDTVAGLGLPTDAAWFEITSQTGLAGFELFGTQDGNQMAGFTGTGIEGNEGVFSKIATDGFTGIAFVNIEDMSASITLTAHDDDGTVITTESISLTSKEKMVDFASNLFTQDISGATYIHYISDKKVAGFQLNGSSDNLLLDGLPGIEIESSGQ